MRKSPANRADGQQQHGKSATPVVVIIVSLRIRSSAVALLPRNLLNDPPERSSADPLVETVCYPREPSHVNGGFAAIKYTGPVGVNLRELPQVETFALRFQDSDSESLRS